MNIKRKFLLLSVMAFLSTGIVCATDSTKPLIGPVQSAEAREAEAGGCSFQVPGQKGYVFESTDMEHAWVNVNGQDIKLLKSSKNELPDKVGEKSTLKFETKDLEVKINMEKTFEGSAGSSYKGEMQITAGGQKEHIKIEGGCGC